MLVVAKDQILIQDNFRKKAGLNLKISICIEGKLRLKAALRVISISMGTSGLEYHKLGSAKNKTDLFQL